MTDGAPHPEVSILIVSYNTRELTLAAIDSVVRETQIPYEIIVVDNASSDGSADAIRSHPAEPQLIALDDNVGFGRANNVAARHARAPYLLLLNPDTVVLDHAIDRLVGFARSRPDAKIWGGRTRFANGELNPSSCWGRITIWSLACRASGLAAIVPGSPLFNSEAFGGWQRDSIREVDIVSGCFLLIGKALWDQLNGFDPTFFMYGEEADLCLRAGAAGARPAVTPHSTIIHLGGASETARAGKLVKLLAAKMTLIDRHMTGWQRPLGRYLLTLWPLTRLVALAVLHPVSRDQRHRRAYDAWREVWQRRSEWDQGYPDTKLTTAPSTPIPAQQV